MKKSKSLENRGILPKRKKTKKNNMNIWANKSHYKSTSISSPGQNLYNRTRPPTKARNNYIKH